jgi:hypothetical protein
LDKGLVGTGTCSWRDLRRIYCLVTDPANTALRSG